MYPHPIIFGMTLYEICIIIGVIATMLVFRFFADKMRIGAKVQNIILFTIIAAIVGGYYSAILFQAFYDYLATGTFVINDNTGATFYGGLIGGIVAFIIVYFTAGALLVKDGEHKKCFPLLFEIGGVVIPLAHGFGRVGCFFAGCCHGRETDEWYGIYFPSLGGKYVPIQLFEALFLLALFATMFVLLLKSRKYVYTMPIYLAAYGIWRFIAEFYRADNRGETIVEGLTPSQLTAIVLFVAAFILYLLLEKLYVRKKQKKAE